LKYGWLAPLHAKAGEKYPLVICLHGSGGSVKASAVLARQAMREKYPAFVMVPEADRSFTWAKTEAIRRPGMEAMPEKMPVLIEAVRSLMKAEAIDPARIYITGQSMGGVGSWGAIAEHADIFAAAVPVCGAWPVEDVPKMIDVPVWAFHGEKDPTVPVKFSRDLTGAIAKAGGVSKYTEYPGVGHDSWTKAYEEPEMWAWLFAQRRGAAAK
jgi:predicted peptidase